MDNSSDSSENWLITLDRMMLPSDDSGIGRHIGGPFYDTEDDGRLVIGVRRRRDPLGVGVCAQIAAKGAKCLICLSEVAVNERVILFHCGHWVQRVCYHTWSVRGFQMKCPYRCKKDQQGFRSLELMSVEHDVNEAELTDVEELLQRDRKLDKVEETVNHPTPTPPAAQQHSHTDGHYDTSYDGDSEDIRRSEQLVVRKGRQRARRRAHRREMLERGLQELEGQERVAHREEPPQNPQQSRQTEQRPPGWFFDEAITDGGDDFGMSDGLTLAQRMYNLPPGRTFL